MQVSRIWKIGNSCVLTLNSKVLAAANLKLGDKVAVRPNGSKTLLVKCVNFDKIFEEEKPEKSNENQ